MPVAARYRCQSSGSSDVINAPKNRGPMTSRTSFGFLFLVASAANAQAQSPADAALGAKVDSIARQVLQATGVPSATIAVVKNGRLAYANAYGCAKLDPCVAAKPDMRYAVGSISKQFTAVALLLLQQDGKLSINDPVSRFIPGPTR